jgi:hypothetical protein
MSDKQESDGPSGTVTIRWSGVFEADWRTNPHRPAFDVSCAPGMPKDQLVALLRFAADDIASE